MDIFSYHLVAILTSVISAVYYLNVIKEIFFDTPEYKINPYIKNLDMYASITKNNVLIKNISFKYNNIYISSYLTITISVLTLIILIIYIYA